MTDLRVTSQVIDGRTHARVIGEIDVATAEPFRKMVDDICRTGSTVVLDLSECTFIDSTGLREVARLCSRPGSGDPRVVLGELSHPVKRVFDVAGVADLFARAV